jgi:CDP-diacylglycerol--glycerol-3-phosphate 3-phosphatidyltransferase
VSRFLYAVAVVLTVISGAQYFWNCRKIVFSV